MCGSTAPFNVASTIGVVQDCLGSFWPMFRPYPKTLRVFCGESYLEFFTIKMTIQIIGSPPIIFYSNDTAKQGKHTRMTYWSSFDVCPGNILNQLLKDVSRTIRKLLTHTFHVRIYFILFNFGGHNITPPLLLPNSSKSRQGLENPNTTKIYLRP